MCVLLMTTEELTSMSRAEDIGFVGFRVHNLHGLLPSEPLVSGATSWGWRYIYSDRRNPRSRIG